MRFKQQFFAAAVVCATVGSLSGCGRSEPQQGQSKVLSSSVDDRIDAYEHPSQRRALDRSLDADESRILAIDDPKQRALAAINAGKLALAGDIVAALPTSVSDRDWDQIKAKLSAAVPVQVNPNIEIDFPAKVEQQWIPQLKTMTLAVPATLDDLWKMEGQFELMAANLEGDRLEDANGHRLPDTPAMAAARKKLRAALAAKQAQAFPIMRRAYVKLMSDKLWVDNVEVRSQGGGLLYTAAVFADNGNVQTAEQAVAADIEKLRFKTVAYNWYVGGRTWVYKLNAPNDTAVGSWGDGGVFQPSN